MTTLFALDDVMPELLKKVTHFDPTDLFLNNALTYINNTHVTAIPTKRKINKWNSRCYRYTTEDVCVYAGTFDGVVLATPDRINLDDVVIENGNAIKLLKHSGDSKRLRNDTSPKKKFRPFTNDHSVPLSQQCRNGIIQGCQTLEQLYWSVVKLNHITQITADQQNALNKAGLSKAMPVGWNGDPFARLRTIGETHLHVLRGYYSGEYFIMA
jgi:hypothetical protein